MTVTLEEDFHEFVVARWGELEPVAHLVTLDARTARRVTTDALADLHDRWGRLLDDGSPGAAARKAVLTGAIAAAGRAAPGRPARGADDGGRGLGAHPDDPPPDEVLAALTAAVRAAAPLERAVLAAGTAWGLDPSALADLLGMPPATLREADRAVRARLLSTHTEARADAGWEPAEWALDRDVAATVDALLVGHEDPPDAVALVGERHRQVRRRSVVLGTGAALASTAVAAWAVDAVVTGAASEAAPLPPAPGDPVWAVTSSWPPRGRLAAEADVVALVAGASPRARLLYADDVASRRVVIASTADASGVTGTLVRMWTGPRGATAAALLPTALVRDRVALMDDVVPVAVDAGPDDEDGAGAVVLLARPTVLEAQYSPVVTYLGNGGVDRRWTQVPLGDGVATVALRGPLPPAFRVRLDGFDGGPLGRASLGLPVPDDPTAPLGEALLEALGPFVSACTGLPVSALQNSLAVQATVDGDVLVPVATGERAGRKRVVVAHTLLPNGALLRTVRVAGDGRSDGGPVDVETTRVVAAAGTPVPFATRLPGFRSDASRFLVVAPGATRAQLVGTASNTYPASEVTTLRDGTGVLEVADARRAALYRLVTWDGRGRRLGAWEVQFRRRDPRDLWPRVR
ncbi:MAG TPA: antitoxin Xre-like helix-turn-helix domain-containing protein [Ornithinibacter sp.]|nr:antitoxin Xre-like helix-turn-helix domain-containing protein [Ornithinibacter sp.]